MGTCAVTCMEEADVDEIWLESIGLKNEVETCGLPLFQGRQFVFRMPLRHLSGEEFQICPAWRRL